MFLLLGCPILLIPHIVHGNIMRSPLRGKTGNDTSGQNHQNRPIQYALIQKPNRFPGFRLPQNHTVTDHHSRKRGCHVGATQPEYHGPLVLGKAERLLGKPRRNEFRQSNQRYHHRRHFDTFPIPEESTVIYQHPHSYQKKRNEKRIPHKLHPAHQRRSVRYQPVQCDSRQKGANNRLQTSQMGKIRTQKDQHQNENVLGYAIATLLEKPMRQQREKEHDDHHTNNDGYSQLPPKHVVNRSRSHAHNHRKQQQGQRVRNHRSPDRYRNRLVPRDSQLADNRICDKRLRGKKPRQQYRRINRESQNIIPGQNSQTKGNAKGIQAKNQTPPTVAFKIRHVHVEPRQKHDIKQTCRPRKDNATVPQHQIQSVRTNHRTGNDEPQQIRNLELVQNQGSHQNNHQNQQKLQYPKK